MEAANDAANDPRGADRSNWRTAPFSRWAFQHVRELMPVAEVAAASGGARELPEAPRPLDAFALAAGGGRTFTLDEALRRRRATASWCCWTERSSTRPTPTA